MNCWPPFLGAGIRVKTLAADYREALVEMKLRWYNRNYVRTHFGGSLYSMTDPFYMLMLLHVLGKDYIVWDHSGSIEYLAPGKGTMRAHFVLSDAQIAAVLDNTASGEKHLAEFVVEVKDESNAIVARVKKIIYVRRKMQSRSIKP